MKTLLLCQSTAAPLTEEYLGPENELINRTNEGYITQIENKQNLPSMEGFLYICRYLEITPEEFFASDNQNPEMLRKMVEDIKTLTPGQIDSLNKTISEFKIANKFKKP